MTSRIARLFTSITFLLLFACKPGIDPSTLNQVQQQRAGDYTVTVLSDSGAIKQGSSRYVIEFRKTPDNKLSDVGKVEVSPVMEMSGMAPMMGGADVTPTE